MDTFECIASVSNVIIARFCDDASKKYLSLVPQITELSSHVRPKNHSITSLEAAALTGAEGEKKKSYKFSSFFGFSGRKSKERSSSIPDVAGKGIRVACGQ